MAVLICEGFDSYSFRDGRNLDDVRYGLLVQLARRHGLPIPTKATGLRAHLRYMDEAGKR